MRQAPAGSTRIQQVDKQQINQELDEVRKALLSFAEFAKTASPEILVTLIQSVVDRIYIVTADGVTKCHIYLKGCPDEDYSDLIGTADYISICAILIPVVSRLCDCSRYREHHPFGGVLPAAALA